MSKSQADAEFTVQDETSATHQFHYRLYSARRASDKGNSPPHKPQSSLAETTAINMAPCRDHRWHATPEEADACIKHLQDKNFDNLSTMSRTRERTRSPSLRTASSPLSSPPSSPAPSTGSRHTRTPSQSPELSQPSGQETQNLPGVSQHGNDGVRRTQSDPGADPVDIWTREVARQTPETIPVDNIDDRPPTPGPEEPVQPAGTPPSTLPGHTTPPRRRRSIRMGERDAEEGRDEHTPSKTATDHGARLAGPDQPWYRSENFRRRSRAGTLALLVGILFMIAGFFLAGRDADRFP